MLNVSQQSAVRILSTSLLCLLFSLPLQAQAPPSADTFVSSSTAKVNYGPAITLVVGSGTTTYVQFNLSAVPAGATVSKATLRLYVDAVVKSGSFDVYQLNGSWSESTLTYNTPPPSLGTSATGNNPISVTTASWNQFLLIDITPLVQGWVNGSIANNGVALALTNGSSGYFSFDSKESLLTGNGPELEIALAGTPGAQGPPGPQGQQGSVGSQGAAGPQGIPGPAGATGAQGPIGPVGPQGTPGAQGPPGIDGATGAQGAPGAAGQGFAYKSAFDSTASYSPYDVVSFNGSSYVAKSATNAGDPMPDVNPAWSVMAQQGAAGAQGPAGATGPQGPSGSAGAQGQPGSPGPPGSVGGTGAAGSLATWSTPTTLQNSVIKDDGATVTVGGALDVTGSFLNQSFTTVSLGEHCQPNCTPNQVTNSTTFIPITNMSITITPQRSGPVLVLYSVFGQLATGSVDLYVEDSADLPPPYGPRNGHMSATTDGVGDFSVSSSWAGELTAGEARTFTLLWRCNPANCGAAIHSSSDPTDDYARLTVIQLKAQ